MASGSYQPDQAHSVSEALRASGVWVWEQPAFQALQKEPARAQELRVQGGGDKEHRVPLESREKGKWRKGMVSEDGNMISNSFLYLLVKHVTCSRKRGKGNRWMPWLHFLPECRFGPTLGPVASQDGTPSMALS